MTIDEFEPEDVLLEISRKLSNVSIHKLPAHGGTVEKDAVSVGQYGVFHDVQDPIWFAYIHTIQLPTIKYLLFSSERDQIKQSIRLLRRYLTQGNLVLHVECTCMTLMIYHQHVCRS